MKRFPVRLLVALFTFCIGILAVAGWFFFYTYKFVTPSSPPMAQITPTNVNNPSLPRWGSILYPYLDQHTSLVKLAELRSTSLPQEDLEVRVWLGFGLTPLEGFILKRTAGQWSAFYLEGDNYYEPKKVKMRELLPPHSSWESCWERLVAAGIRTVPDSSEIDYDVGGTDGWAYLVELREGDSYRAFHYQFPEYSRRAEARQVLEIGNTIGDEFQLPSFKEKKVSDR